MGWILFLEENGRGKATPHAWPDATTRISVQGGGYRLSSGGGTGSNATVIDTDEVEHTLDFQQVMMWLNPEDEEAEPADGGEGP